MQLTYTLSEDNHTRIHSIDCEHTVDKNGKHWIWSNKLEHNLVYKSDTFENALLASIASLLYTIELRDERIASLQHVANLAQAFADQIKPDCQENHDY